MKLKKRVVNFILLAMMLVVLKPALVFANEVNISTATVTMDESTKIGEHDGDAAYYAQVAAGTTAIEFTDFNADDVYMISRHDMMAEDTIMSDNVCMTYSSFLASKDEIDEFLDDGLSAEDDNDYSNTYGFCVYTQDDEYYFFFINVEEAPVTFSTIYGSGKLSSNTYSYYDYMAGKTQEYPLYVLNVPAGVETVDLSLSKECLVYNYDGKGNYIAGWVDDYTKGSTKVTVAVDAKDASGDADGEADYIQIQNPYNADYTGGELLFAIKLNPVSFTTNVGEYKLIRDTYAYYDYMAGVTNNYPVFELKVPATAETVDLQLSEECLVYNYDGKGNYLAGWVDDYTKGTTNVTVAVDAKDAVGNSDGEPDYIQIQNPYNADYSGGEMIFAIKLSYYKSIKSATISENSYPYDGKEKKPGVTVINDSDETLKQDVDYTVTYEGNCTDAGEYKVIVKGKGDYNFTETLTFTIKAAENKEDKKEENKEENKVENKVENKGDNKVDNKDKTKEEIKSIALNKVTYTYDGKVKKPKVIAKAADGTILKNEIDYTVVYATGCKKVGTYKITVNGLGNYVGTKTTTFVINPRGTSLTKVKALGGRKIEVSWKKQTTQVTGYQIRYSNSSSMEKAKKVKVNAKSASNKIIKATTGKRYVQIRTYKAVGGKTYYSNWSKVKSVKVK